MSRILLFMREHIEQTTSQEDKKIVDLFTQELIDEIKERKTQQYIYIPFEPILK